MFSGKLQMERRRLRELWKGAAVEVVYSLQHDWFTIQQPVFMDSLMKLAVEKDAS
jgi:hypothetical protein